MPLQTSAAFPNRPNYSLSQTSENSSLLLLTHRTPLRIWCSFLKRQNPSQECRQPTTLTLPEAGVFHNAHHASLEVTTTRHGCRGSTATNTGALTVLDWLEVCALPHFRRRGTSRGHWARAATASPADPPPRRAREADTSTTGTAAGLPAPGHPDLNRRPGLWPGAFPDNMGDHTYRVSHDDPADCARGGGSIR